METRVVYTLRVSINKVILIEVSSKLTKLYALQGATPHDIQCTKGLWYPSDIRLISLISGCWIWSKHGCLLRFFEILLWSLPIYTWLIFRYIQHIFFNFPQKSVQTFIWNLIKFLLIFVYYTSDIRLISLIAWYPVNRFTSRYPLTLFPCFTYKPTDRGLPKTGAENKLQIKSVKKKKQEKF